MKLQELLLKVAAFSIRKRTVFASLKVAGAVWSYERSPLESFLQVEPVVDRKFSSQNLALPSVPVAQIIDLQSRRLSRVFHLSPTDDLRCSLICVSDALGRIFEHKLAGFNRTRWN